MRPTRGLLFWGFWGDSNQKILQFNDNALFNVIDNAAVLCKWTQLEPNFGKVIGKLCTQSVLVEVVQERSSDAIPYTYPLGVGNYRIKKCTPI